MGSNKTRLWFARIQRNKTQQKHGSNKTAGKTCRIQQNKVEKITDPTKQNAKMTDPMNQTLFLGLGTQIFRGQLKSVTSISRVLLILLTHVCQGQSKFIEVIYRGQVKSRLKRFQPKCLLCFFAPLYNLNYMFSFSFDQEIPKHVHVGL